MVRSVPGFDLYRQFNILSTVLTFFQPSCRGGLPGGEGVYETKVPNSTNFLDTVNMLLKGLSYEIDFENVDEN
jgi:hypothetical protein